MSNDLDPIDVAHHWPFIRKNLLLERWPAAARALDVLAATQFEADGQAVAFGTTFWQELDLTAAQIGSTTRALRELERRGVIGHFSRPARRAPHAWTFNPSIVNWRGMPWSGRGRNVETVVRGCSCRAPRVPVALVPGQSGVLSRTWPLFRLPADDHLWRPGLFPVDVRDGNARCATGTRRPGLLPVEVRDGDAARAPLYLASKEISKEISLSEKEERGFSALLKAINRASPPGETLWPGSKPEARLRLVAAAANGQADRIAERVGRQSLRGPLAALAMVERLASDPELLDDSVPAAESFEERKAKKELRAAMDLARYHRQAGEPVPDHISQRITELSQQLGTMEG